MTDRGVDDGTERADGRRWRVLAVRLIRGVLLLAGLAVSGVGVAVVFDPEAERLIPVEAAITTLGSDYVVVAVVGLLAVGLSVLVVAARAVRGVDEADPPLVEAVQSATYPGERLDRSTGGSEHRRAGDPPSDDRRERLSEAAVRATMRADGCSRSVAERRVAEGSWTTDPVAVRSLSDARDGGGWGWRGRNGSLDAQAVRRTVDAIVRLTDERGTDREDERDSGVSE
ncbi:DUF7269 family protein [Halobaculum magnesiiphilum]|uniref:Uncharacterized protein n=1 Tax=Halobaculum magnesiiphilum TaxID=1017351 RepID=A0A8T8WAD1_9EURY|nr:hypothetical protein [Halobaculum magnesiiphilum]QZP36786.1 hypothetical protein K6T50_10780 [Halobaculum magnesiiphilum]